MRAAILVRDLHDEPQVRFDQLARGGVVAVLDQAHRERVLLCRREQRVAPGLGHVQAQGIAPGERSSARRRGSAGVRVTIAVGITDMRVVIIDDFDHVRRFGEVGV